MEDNELLIPLEIENEVPDNAFGTSEEIIRDYGYLPYNQFLYDKRKEKDMSRYQFSKMIGLHYYRYVLIEKGHTKPKNKEIELISKALDVDYSQYLNGIASYPSGLMAEDDGEPKKRIIRTKAFRLTMIILLLFFISTYFISRIYNSNINSFSEIQLKDNYKSLIEEVSKSEEFTYTLTGTFKRPMIFERKDKEYISIIGEYDLHPFNLDFNYTIYEEDYRITYNTSISKMDINSITIKTTYVDYKTYDEAKGTFIYKKNDGYELQELFESGTNNKISDSLILERLNNYINNFNNEIETTINNSLGIKISIENDILNDIVPIMKKINKVGYISLLIYLISLVNIAISAVLLTYSFIGGKQKHSEYLLSELDYEDKILDEFSETKAVPKDIKIGPVIPERLFQVVGGIFTTLSIAMSLVYFILNVLGKANTFSTVGLNSLLTLLSSGIFIMLFIDFDIYLNDRRVLRNVIIYAIIFFFIYNIQVLVIDYLSQISLGLLAIEKFNIRLPNYFGSFSCYFLLLTFLFTNPRWANTKKRLYIYRHCALIPVTILFTTTVISMGYKSWGWHLPNSLLYLVDTARPQFSLMVVAYLIGLFILRTRFKMLYDVKNAVRCFNGNRYLLYKNILAFSIAVVISFLEIIFMNNPAANEIGLGLYPTFFIFGLLLLFYRPNIGKRKPRTERATLVLNTILFGSLYIIVAIAMVIVIALQI